MESGASTPATEPLEDREASSPVYYRNILGIALLMRGALAAFAAKGDPRFWFFHQASEYGCLAQSMLSGHGYASPFGGSTGPSAFLAPGYPLLVAGAFRLLGAYSRGAAAALIGLQVLFGLLTVLAAMLLAKRLLGSRLANVAGVLCAISPPLVCLPILFWETSLSMLLLTAAILLALRCVDKPNPGRWLGFGSFCALAMFVNPSLLLTFATILIWMAWHSGIAGRRGPALALLAWCILFSAWPIRNAYSMHAFVPLRTNLGYELWQGNRPGSNGSFAVALHPNTSMDEYTRYAELGELNYMREKSQLAIAAIEADRPRFLRLCAKRFATFWFKKIEPGSSPLLALDIAVTSLMSVLGLGLLFWRLPQIASLIVIPFVVLPAPYYLTHADFRFRLLLDPLAILLTVFAFRELQILIRARSHRQAATNGVLDARVHAQG